MWLVTGATGFVGGHIVRTLGSRARGLDRRALVAWSAGELRRQLDGIDGVVHAASIVHRPATPSQEYERFNVDGTRALLDAAELAGVRRFVFLSSIKVHGEDPVGTIDEHTAIRAEAHYARTKAAAEALVLERTSVAPVVLRLCPVYGRGDKGNVRTMIRAIARRRFLLPGEGTTQKSIVHVSTVAAVVEAALEMEARGVFVVADRHAPSIRELSTRIARLVGRRPPPSVPVPLVRAAASLVGRVARLAGVSSAVSAQLIDKALTSSVCDPRRVEAELGVRCEVDLDEALTDEIAWLRGLGAI